METLYRPKSPSKFTPKQKQDKLVKDTEYELASNILTEAFYTKERTVGVTPQEEADYRQAKHQLWADWLNWAISAGLYDIVTLEQQLAEEEVELNNQITKVNEIKVELGQKTIKIVEVK